MKRQFIAACLVLLVVGCIQQGAANTTNATAGAPPAQACSGGSMADIFVAGSFTYNGSTFTDACLSDGTVKKFYCDGNELKTEVMPCPQDTACKDGACIPNNLAESRPAAKCVATTAADDYYAAGTATYNGTTYSDVCQGLYNLVKYSCDNDTVSQGVYHCPEGDQCSDGACVHVETCTDTDVQDPSAAGTTTLYGGGRVIMQVQDTCINSSTQIEYGCGNGTVVNTTVTCAKTHFCYEGACLPPCIATVSGIIANGTAYTNACRDNRTFVRYTCYGSSPSTVELPCTTCMDGKCT
jgi:hypothetical protein